MEYTDNATLSADNPVDDLIAVGYIGAKLEEADGPLRGGINASLNHQSYTNDTFADQTYWNLRANAAWEMIKNRFDWFLRNVYGQRTIDTTDPNTPDNIQDSNIFNFGASIFLPLTARQTFTLRPEYSKFYYEVQTDSQQYSLGASWNYLVNPSTSVGLDGNARTVDYDEPAISDVTFTSVFLSLTNKRALSDFSTSVGTTRVERENGQRTEELAGRLNWLLELTGRSTFRTFISGGLTNGGNLTLNSVVDPGTGDSNDVQITTDVIRNRVLTLSYNRVDGTLDSSLSGQLRELNYSESPNDRRIRGLNAVFNYPVTGLLTNGFYARYKYTEYIDTERTDNEYIIGGNLRYRLSRNLNSSFDLKYRNRNSSREQQKFDEWSVFASLGYGFGKPLRPTRSGGF